MWKCKKCGGEVKAEFRDTKVRTYSVKKSGVIDTSTKQEKEVDGSLCFCSNEQCGRFSGMIETIATWEE